MLATYFWITFAASLWCLLRIPSRMTPLQNFGGSVVCALFGFAIWPLCLVAAIRSRRR